MIDILPIEVELTVEIGSGVYELGDIISGSANVSLDYSGEKLLRVNGEPYAWGTLQLNKEEIEFKLTRLINNESNTGSKNDAPMQDVI